MARSIVLVEDEPVILENYSDALTREGYDVKAFMDRSSALPWCKTRLPDLAVLDIRLGREAEAGFDLCRELRAMSSSLPIIFLTARDSDVDIVSGLRVGADDFVSKDTSLPHLLARIAALFRRVDALPRTRTGRRRARPRRSASRRRPNASELEAVRGRFDGDRVLDSARVGALSRSRKDRDQLMQDANILVDDATITSHIKRVRRKFEQLDADFSSIQTVYGLGYRWAEI